MLVKEATGVPEHKIFDICWLNLLKTIYQWLNLLTMNPRTSLKFIMLIFTSTTDQWLIESDWNGASRWLAWRVSGTRLPSIMTSSNKNIFRVIGLWGGESTGYWWIPLTKASDAELWYFLWCAPEETVGQTMETPVIWDAMALIVTSL